MIKCWEPIFSHVERFLCGPLLRSIYRNLGNEDLWWSPTNLTCKKGGIEVIAHTHIMVILKKKNKLQGNSKLGHFSISIETKVPLPPKNTIFVPFEEMYPVEPTLRNWSLLSAINLCHFALIWCQKFHFFCWEEEEKN